MKKPQIIALACTAILFIWVAVLVSKSNEKARNNDTMNNAIMHANTSLPTDVVPNYTDIISDSFKQGIGTLRQGDKYVMYDSISQKTLSRPYDEISPFGNEGTVDYVENKKYGYLNESGNEIVSAKYDFACGFDEGLAAVKIDDKWGYIDKKGVAVIPVENDMAWGFNSGTAPVKKDGKWGFINKKGVYVLPPVYDDVTVDFNEKNNGYAIVSKNGTYFFINRKGKYIRDCKPYEGVIDE